MIEVIGRYYLVSYQVVAVSEPNECLALAYSETEQQVPQEGSTLKFALSLDHTGFFGALFEELRKKQGSEPTRNYR